MGVAKAGCFTEEAEPPSLLALPQQNRQASGTRYFSFCRRSHAPVIAFNTSYFLSHCATRAALLLAVASLLHLLLVHSQSSHFLFTWQVSPEQSKPACPSSRALSPPTFPITSPAESKLEVLREKILVIGPQKVGVEVLPASA